MIKTVDLYATNLYKPTDEERSILVSLPEFDYLKYKDIYITKTQADELSSIGGCQAKTSESCDGWGSVLYTRCGNSGVLVPQCHSCWSGIEDF